MINNSACLFSSGYCGPALWGTVSNQVNSHLTAMLSLQVSQRSYSLDQLFFFSFVQTLRLPIQILTKNQRCCYCSLIYRIWIVQLLWLLKRSFQTWRNKLCNFQLNSLYMNKSFTEEIRVAWDFNKQLIVMRGRKISAPIRKNSENNKRMTAESMHMMNPFLF